MVAGGTALPADELRGAPRVRRWQAPGTRPRSAGARLEVPSPHLRKGPLRSPRPDHRAVQGPAGPGALTCETACEVRVPPPGVGPPRSLRSSGWTAQHLAAPSGLGAPSDRESNSRPLGPGCSEVPGRRWGHSPSGYDHAVDREGASRLTGGRPGAVGACALYGESVAGAGGRLAPSAVGPAEPWSAPGLPAAMPPRRLGEVDRGERPA